MKYQAVFFDLDGTLVDSVPDIHHSVGQMCEALGLKKPALEEVKSYVGNGVFVLVERVLSGSVDVDPNLSASLKQKALALFSASYEQNVSGYSCCYPYVHEMMEKIGSLPKVLITNKPRQFTLPLLDKLNLTQYFELILCGDDLKEKKPHPLPLLSAAKQLELPVETILMVGDSESDISAARAAGIDSAAVSYGCNHGQPIANTDPGYLIDSLAELPALIID